MPAKGRQRNYEFNRRDVKGHEGKIEDKEKMAILNFTILDDYFYF